MKNIIILLLLLISSSFSAQLSFRTGSASLDTDLSTINADAKVNIGAFNTNLSTTYNISERRIERLRADLDLQPAEIYLSLELGRIANRSIDEVIAVYKKHKGKGWGVVAKELGIKPGSPEFHALKNSTKTKKNKGHSKTKVESKGNSHGNSGNGNSGNSGKGKGKK